MVSWTVIATTGERFSSFGPYVASVNGAGTVAFQAVRSDGGTGVFTSSGEGVTEIGLPSSIGGVTSHPDVNDTAATSFYGDLAIGGQAVFVVQNGRTHVVADTGGLFSSIGPAGPTMNEEGVIAFRADRSPDTSGVFAWDGGALGTVAESGDDWGEFHGLPVVDERGCVVFRADRPDGSAGIYRAEHGSVRALLETGEEFETIGLFPSVAADGAVAFAATLRDGGGGVFVARDGRIAKIQTHGAFESYRGALICDVGVVRIATPSGGTLGLFAGPDPEADRILAAGDPLFGSTIEEFAANPVSVTADGQLVVRLTLADGRGFILRCEPFCASPRVRHAARIVMVDADERVLLFGYRDPTTGNEFWATTGGGIEPGESALEAAQREHREETGHDAPHDLGPVVWHRTTGFEWDGAWMQADEVFFYVRVDGLVVSESHVATLRTEGVIGHRWLSLDELRGSDLEVYPVGLADLVGDLLANGPPTEPMELRE